MSRWNRPMRAWKPATFTCATCGAAIRPGEYGGFTHVRRLKITDPAWHEPRPQ